MADLSELETRISRLERKLRATAFASLLLFLVLCGSVSGLFPPVRTKAQSLTLSDGKGELELTPTEIDMANSKGHVVFHILSDEHSSLVEAQLANQSGDPIWDVSCNKSATGMMLNMANGHGAFDYCTKDNKEMDQIPTFTHFHVNGDHLESVPEAEAAGMAK